ncbi:MAG: RrF2 family transcriptional regulator [Bacteroidota bacterium]
MHISTRGRYGLRALVDLAAHAGRGPVALREIAGRQDISESYLEQVFAALRKAGLVIAIRGPQGGYELGKPAEEITAGEVLRALEGPLTPVECVVELGGGRRCRREAICPTRGFWRELGRHIETFVNEVTLEDLVKRAAMAQADLPMYYI